MSFPENRARLGRANGAWVAITFAHLDALVAVIEQHRTLPSSNEAARAGIRAAVGAHIAGLSDAEVCDAICQFEMAIPQPVVDYTRALFT